MNMFIRTYIYTYIYTYAYDCSSMCYWVPNEQPEDHDERAYDELWGDHPTFHSSTSDDDKIPTAPITERSNKKRRAAKEAAKAAARAAVDGNATLVDGDATVVDGEGRSTGIDGNATVVDGNATVVDGEGRSTGIDGSATSIHGHDHDHVDVAEETDEVPKPFRWRGADKGVSMTDYDLTEENMDEKGIVGTLILSGCNITAPVWLDENRPWRYTFDDPRLA
jgi:hypothetical protein